MKNILYRFNYAIKSENGSPMVETICAISVALIVLVGIFYTGYCILNYIGSALDNVKDLNPDKIV